MGVETKEKSCQYCGQAKTAFTARDGSDPNANTRRSAAVALGSIGKEAQVAVPALTKALADPDQYVRSASGRALTRIAFTAPVPVVPALRSALRSTDVNVREQAAKVLSSIRNRTEDPALREEISRILREAKQ